MSTKNHLRIRALTEGAMLVAAAQVLSLLKLYEFPQGGSVTAAMFPVLLYAVRWGLGRGLLAGFAFGTLQLIFDGAYAWGIFPGTVLGCLGRFAVHYLSGVTIYRINMPTQIPGFGVFDSAELYSLVYNGCYMVPCTVIALAIAAALYVPMKRFFEGRDLC